MSTPKRFIVRSVLVFVLAGTAMAQEMRAPVETPGSPGTVSSGPLVTVTASARRVRFVSPGTVVQLRLEVYNEAGQKLFDTELRGGNVLDWHLQDGAGQRLAAGSYACVLTIKSLSGRLSQRKGIVTVNEKSVAAAGDTQLSMAQQQTIGPVEGNAAFTVRQEPDAITAVTHDGADGQLTSTAGALTFRTGDVFAGLDKEHMRITPEGNVGIGTDKPQSTLDVAGTIRTVTLRTAGGVEFADGSRLNLKEGKLVSTNAAGEPQEVPNVAGTGTTGRLPKWTDGPTGTLGDSILGESGNGVVLRAPSGGAGINPMFINPNNIGGFAQLQAYPASGTNTNLTFGVVPRGTGVTNNRAQITVFNTDFIANPTNYEFASLRARGSDFVVGTGKKGTGMNRPIMFATGFLSDNTTNNGQLYLATSGNVGIGTTGPTFKLHLVDPSNTGLRVQTNALGGTVASFGGRGDFQIDAPGVFGGRFIVNEAGRVGIGTPTPLAKLDIQAGADSDGQFDPKAMAFQYRTGGFRHWIRTRHNSIPGSGNAIDFFVNDSATAGGSTGPGLGSGSAHVMTLDGGRVGIGGVLTPTEALSVQGTIQSLFGGFKFPDASVQTTAAANATYTTVNDTDTPVSTNYPDETVLLQLNLPAGTYLVTASSVFFNGANYFNANNSRLVMCRFSGEAEADGVEGYRHTVTIQGLTRIEMSFHSIVTIPAGVTDVRCRAFSWYGDLTAESRRLTAVKLSGDVVVQ